MTRTWYIAPADAGGTASIIAHAVATALARTGARVATLGAVAGLPAPFDASSAPSAQEVRLDEQAAASHLAERTSQAGRSADHVVVCGVGSGIDFRLNAALAANIGAALLPVWDGAPTHAQVDAAVHEAEREHAHVALAICTGNAPHGSSILVASWHRAVAQPQHTLLSGPPVPAGLAIQKADDRVASTLDALRADGLLVMSGDRDDLLLALPIAAGLGRPVPRAVLCCGRAPDQAMVDMFARRLPQVSLAHTTQGVTPAAASWAGPGEQDIAAVADQLQLTDRLSSILPGSPVTTPVMFQQGLFDVARRANRHIVLPEGTDDRILQAAHILLQGRICTLTILGDAPAIQQRAASLGLDLSQARIINPGTDPVRERYADLYAELRKAKGVTREQALERMSDVSYFGTMMVKAGDADGMVSGACNTTAHTIRPAFEVIKTRPGVSIVSSVFLMCLADRVLVFGDCAVNPNPTAEQLAEIALSSAETAAAFGIEPRVAMLSYSTGTSGSGPDVDRVSEATRIAQQRAPRLAVDGPLQFDAAVDATVGAKKMPGSLVAGRATVLVFPDLDAGNNAYKAVQRTAGALAIGPVLQGLNRPINDLSRGALVDDIVNTVAITAIQAGNS